MKKQMRIALPLCSLVAGSLVSAEETGLDVFLLPEGASAGATSVSTSMHDAGSAAANYTLGNGGGGGVQTTTGSPSNDGQGGSAVYDEPKYDSGSGASSSPRARRSRRSRSTSTVNTPSTYAGEKDAKGVVPMPAPYNPSPLIITVEGGYQSQYVYNGLNRINLSDYNTLFRGGSDDSDMYYLGADMKWKGFSVGLKYIRSLASDRDPLFSPVVKSLAYTEYVFDVNYTLGLFAGPQGTGNWLDATLGYEFTYFPEDKFWNTDSQHKFYATVKMNRYKWVRPSLTYQVIESGDVLTNTSLFPGFDMLSGEQFIIQVDGGDVVYSNGGVKVGLGYYAKYGMGSGYQLASVLNEDWYEAGISIPVSIGNLTISPSVHYTVHDADTLVEEPGFWWGINAKYTF